MLMPARGRIIDASSLAFNFIKAKAGEGSSAARFSTPVALEPVT